MTESPRLCSSTLERLAESEGGDERLHPTPERGVFVESPCQQHRPDEASCSVEYVFQLHVIFTSTRVRKTGPPALVVANHEDCVVFAGLGHSNVGDGSHFLTGLRSGGDMLGGRQRVVGARSGPYRPLEPPAAHGFVKNLIVATVGPV